MIKNHFLTLTSRWLKLGRSFDDKRHHRKYGYFGLGQFVLLIALTPFIFDLKLYSIGELKEVPSLYEYDAERFEPLPIYPTLGDPPRAPRKPLPLKSEEIHTLNFCAAFSRVLKRNQINPACLSLKKKKAQYEKRLVTYPAELATYVRDLEKYKTKIAQRKQAETAYQNFDPALSSKPQPQPPIEVKQYSSRSFTALMSDRIAVNLWQDTGIILWLMGMILIVPAIWLGIRWKCWSLLIMGLTIPAINYLLFLFSLIPSAGEINQWQINSSIGAQVAFLWFIFKGHIASRSHVMFILLLVIFASWTAVLLGDNYSIIKAQLPILVFIIASIIGRLLIKMIKENRYLFTEKSVSENIRHTFHAFILWLPLLALALPIFYFFNVSIPKSIINHLHENRILQFNYQHDFLDNTLQSIALKADDTAYAWHLNTQNIKRDIFQRQKSLLNENLQKRVEVTFDQVMPRELSFNEYQSDKAIVGPAIDFAVAASQDSTNDAFKNFRKKIKQRLSNIAAKYEAPFKQAVRNKTADALIIVDSLYQEGKVAIVEANQNGQTAAWWSINYVRAAHMLSIMLFIFVCIKSFSYVFARVSFNRNTGTFVTLGSLDSLSVDDEPSIQAAGLHYTISDHNEETFYISRRFQCRGKAPKFSIPQASRAPIARLVHGAYAMNKVIMKKGDDKVHCTATRGIEFFEWNLQANEKVLFDFYHFVGMSNSVHISTHFSTRFSSLLLGKMIYTQAKGPGKLLLMAEGRAEIISTDANNGSLPPERMIAFQKDTRFHIDSEIDLANIYLSTAYVRPAGYGKAIVDVDSQRGTKTGLGSFIKRFLLPV